MAKDNSSINKKKYDISKKEFEYDKYNALKAKDTSDSTSYLWKMYLELHNKLQVNLDDEVLLQQYNDVKYAIAAVDFLEEVACLYYYNEVSKMKYPDMQKKVAEIRYNVIHAKKGGRFRRGDNTAPTYYRSI